MHWQGLQDCTRAFAAVPTTGLSEQLAMRGLLSSRLCTMSNVCLLPSLKHIVCRPVAFQSSGLAKGSSDKPAPPAEVKMEIKQEAPLGPTAGLGATARLGVTPGLGSMAGLGRTAGLGSTTGLGSTAGLGAGATAGAQQEALPGVALDGRWRLSCSRGQQTQPPNHLATFPALVEDVEVGPKTPQQLYLQPAAAVL